MQQRNWRYRPFPQAPYTPEIPYAGEHFLPQNQPPANPLSQQQQMQVEQEVNNKLQGEFQIQPAKQAETKPLVSTFKMVLGATAMAVSYSRNKSVWRSIGASIISLPYLIYVGIDTYKKKK